MVLTLRLMVIVLYMYSGNSGSLCLILSSNTMLWLLHSDYLSINTILCLLHSDGYVNSDISATL